MIRGGSDDRLEYRHIVHLVASRKGERLARRRRFAKCSSSARSVLTCGKVEDLRLVLLR